MIPLTIPEVSRLIAATVRTACGVAVRIAGAWTAIQRSLRCLGERGFALLTGSWRTLQHITASPSKIGDIARAALVRTHFRTRLHHVNFAEITSLASKGIGLAIADEFAREGGQVITGSRSITAQLGKDLTRHGS